MTRPKKDRVIYREPLFSRFKPAGIKAAILDRIDLTIDEYEATRLADYLGYNHLQASKIMNISRSTFSRLIDRARNKIAIFIIEGKELDITGGAIKFAKDLSKCHDCGLIFESKAEILRCPECNSNNIIKLSDSYGHRRGHGRHHGRRR